MEPVHHTRAACTEVVDVMTVLPGQSSGCSSAGIKGGLAGDETARVHADARVALWSLVCSDPASPTSPSSCRCSRLTDSSSAAPSSRMTSRRSGQADKSQALAELL